MHITNFVVATEDYRVLFMQCTCADRTAPPTKELDVVTHRVVGWFFDADTGSALPGVMRDTGVMPHGLFRNVAVSDNECISVTCELAVKVGKVVIEMEHAIMHGLDEHYAREVKRANG